MTIDVNVQKTTEDFLEDIDEIIEDTMVQIFFLQPRDAEALQKAKEDAQEHNAIFYVAPLDFEDEIDVNCIGFSIKESAQLQERTTLDKPLFIDESDLDEAFVTLLKERKEQGIILNATDPHEELENFLIAIGPANIEAFDPEVLASLSMDKIALQSGYPDHDFDDIMSAVKIVSDAMFRPEQSIIARATTHVLQLTGFKQ